METNEEVGWADLVNQIGQLHDAKLRMQRGKQACHDVVQRAGVMEGSCHMELPLQHEYARAAFGGLGRLDIMDDLREKCPSETDV